MGLFEEVLPCTESYWRSIILFGANVASYKFALGKSLLGIAAEGKTFVALEDLAAPFAQHVSQHIKVVDKQGQRPSGPFLESCRQFNRGEIDFDRLVLVTQRHGFNNVIDAFHTVNGQQTSQRFFIDDRVSKRGITITDDLLGLRDSLQYGNLEPEIEARWRLVETAWELEISRNLLKVQSDGESELFVIDRSMRRKNVTSVRDALNGYQKGKCFYCFCDISLDVEGRADVDHFFPWTLSQTALVDLNLNGVWNLVLACQACNRGPRGKFARLPESKYLERLHTRNNFLISSHHPLRETLMSQSGATEIERVKFLAEHDRNAIDRLLHRWRPTHEHEAAF